MNFRFVSLLLDIIPEIRKQSYAACYKEWLCLEACPCYIPDFVKKWSQDQSRMLIMMINILDKISFIY